MTRTTWLQERRMEKFQDVLGRFEAKSRFARAATSALAPMNGETVGFVCSNPLHKTGALDPEPAPAREEPRRHAAPAAERRSP